MLLLDREKDPRRAVVAAIKSDAIVEGGDWFVSEPESDVADEAVVVVDSADSVLDLEWTRRVNVREIFLVKVRLGLVAVVSCADFSCDGLARELWTCRGDLILYCIVFFLPFF